MTEQRPTLPWGDYVTLLEHEQLGDYGGECKIRVGISCTPCREAGKDFMVATFSGVLPDTMAEVLAKILLHERDRHDRSWMDIK